MKVSDFIRSLKVYSYIEEKPVVLGILNPEIVKKAFCKAQYLEKSRKRTRIYGSVIDNMVNDIIE